MPKKGAQTGTPLYVAVTPEERAEIDQLIEASGLSMHDFILAAIRAYVVPLTLAERLDAIEQRITELEKR